MRLKTDALVGFLLIHLIAVAAVLPWFFSWTGVVVLVLGTYVFGILGINVGFHRLITHRGFTCPLWLERAFAILGTCSLQFSPAYWVAIHRRHHHFAEDEKDPHSPTNSVFWAHMGWLLRRPADMKPSPMIARYARDVIRDPLYALLERHKNWIKITFVSWLLICLAGLVIALGTGSPTEEASRIALSLLVWGCALRTVLVWHVTWSVNSIAHVWGYRNYETRDDSKNNLLIGLLAGGEGWHNNHHAYPSSARHGHRWWEFDITWLTIRSLAKLGLAANLVQH